MKTKLIRVDSSLAEELEKESKRNEMSLVRWSKEVARVLSNKKIKLEIKF